MSLGNQINLIRLKKMIKKIIPKTCLYSFVVLKENCADSNYKESMCNAP